MAPSAGSPAATTTSHTSSQRPSTSPCATPTTTNGRLARRWASGPAGPGAPAERDQHGTGPLEGDGAAQLVEEGIGAEVFDDRETLPCRHGGGSRCERWAASGAMALTGTPDEPLGPPAGLVDGVDRLAAPLRRVWTRWRSWVSAPRSWGSGAGGATSCGGSCRLLPCAGRLPGGVTAARRGHGAGAGMARARAAADLGPRRVVRGRHGTCGVRPAPTARTGPCCWGCPSRGSARRPGARRCSDRPLGDGATPARRSSGSSSSTCRPCGRGPCAATCWPGPAPSWSRWSRRSGPTGRGAAHREFFDLLNGRKRSVALDIGSPEGVRALRALVRGADVVIEASRPRPWPSSGWTPPTSSPPAGPRSGSPSPATAAPARPPIGSRSATTPRLPAGWWSGATGPPVLRRRRRRPAHRAHRGRRLPGRARGRRPLAPRRVHVGRQRRAGRSDPGRAAWSVRGAATGTPGPGEGAGSRRRHGCRALGPRHRALRATWRPLAAAYPTLTGSDSQPADGRGVGLHRVVPVDLPGRESLQHLVQRDPALEPGQVAPRQKWMP